MQGETSPQHGPDEMSALLAGYAPPLQRRDCKNAIRSAISSRLNWASSPWGMIDTRLGCIVSTEVRASRRLRTVGRDQLDDLGRFAGDDAGVRRPSRR